MPETFAVSGRGPIWALGVFFPTFFLLLGESSMYQKFFSAKSAVSARRAALGMVIGVMAIESALAFVAIVGAGLAPEGALSAATDGGARRRAQTENIILHLARLDLPIVAGCLLLGAGLAIIFSTGNTFLMVPAINLRHDIYKRFLNPEASDVRWCASSAS